MTADIYKEATRCGDKKYADKMTKECKAFGELAALKVNRQKELALVLAENSAKFPWLMSVAVGMMFNDKPMGMYSAINLIVGTTMNKFITGGEKEKGAAAFDANDKDSKEQGSKE